MKYQKSTFKSIGNLIEPLVRKHTEVNVISHAKLLNIWETIVGEDISRKAKPIRIKTVKGGQENILFLGMKGYYMAELSLQKESIIEKINAFFGYQFIKDVRLILIKEKIDKKVKYHFNENQKAKLQKKIEKIGDSNLKKNLTNLINVFNRKK